MPSRRPTFSDWVTSTGTALGYTNDASLARALGIQQSTISRWKKNSTKPGVEHLARISELFGVDIKVLLVLAGYLEATPPSPEELHPRGVRTKAEQMINDAKVATSYQRELLQRFWASRLEEEQERLARLIDFTERAVKDGLNRARVKEELKAQTRTDATSHFSDFAHSLTDALLEEGVVVDFNDGRPFGDTGWYRPSGEVDDPLPPFAHSLIGHWDGPETNVPIDESRWRALLVAPDGTAIAWTGLLPLLDASEALIQFHKNLGYATSEGSSDAPEEES